MTVNDRESADRPVFDDQFGRARCEAVRPAPPILQQPGKSGKANT
jgi:hypothetical protein